MILGQKVSVYINSMFTQQKQSQQKQIGSSPFLSLGRLSSLIIKVQGPI